MKIALTISTLLLAGNLFAQERVAHLKGVPHVGKDLSLLQQAFSATPKVRLSEQFSLSRENPNELQTVLSGLFLFYKSFFSSQDNQRCSFHPSCSEYGLEAVKKLGVVRGIMCTCDRLTRCNGFSPEQYEIDMEHRRLKDPVGW
ncbi:MAG: membrane protein insertion efficiency factor YidD [Phycisphaerae bacterium]|nr:membrane protein insertion efficiency factor YidD [Saprospiraceae bacterium]